MCDSCAGSCGHDLSDYERVSRRMLPRETPDVLDVYECTACEPCGNVVATVCGVLPDDWRTR